MDAPIRGKRAGILVIRRRYQCRQCSRTFFEPLIDMNERHSMTKRLVLYLVEQSLRHPFTHVADEVGIDERTVRRIFQEDNTSLNTVAIPHCSHIGIDEVHLLHRPRCVISDLTNHQIVELLRDRNKATVLTYFSDLPKIVKEQITVVCTDMYANYHEIVRLTLPQARLVVDKWHVLKMLSQCLETVRKEVRASLSESQRRTLMHDRYLLLRRAHDLDEHDTLIVETWLKNFSRLEIAYRLKESFYDIYEASTEEEALQRYFAWFTQITPDVADAFLPFTLAIEHYGDAIFNYFEHRITAGYTECLNGLIKSAQRNSRGFSFEVLRTKVLQTGGLHRMSRPEYGASWQTRTDVITHDASCSDDIDTQTAFAIARPDGSGTPLPAAFIAPEMVKFGNSKSSGKP